MIGFLKLLYEIHYTDSSALSNTTCGLSNGQIEAYLDQGSTQGCTCFYTTQRDSLDFVSTECF